MYASNEDWVFSSIKLHGKQPRTATTMVADYIRPRAVELKIIEPDCTRFGFHNFRHSLAAFRQMLRQSNVDTTLLYAHMDDARIHAEGRLSKEMLPNTTIQ